MDADLRVCRNENMVMQLAATGVQKMVTAVAATITQLVVIATAAYKFLPENFM